MDRDELLSAGESFGYSWVATYRGPCLDCYVLIPTHHPWYTTYLAGDRCGLPGMRFMQWDETKLIRAGLTYEQSYVPKADAVELGLTLCRELAGRAEAAAHGYTYIPEFYP